jgi:hypothetical protein
VADELAPVEALIAELEILLAQSRARRQRLRALLDVVGERTDVATAAAGVAD